MTIAAFYADSFIAAGPKGSMAFRNDEQFIQWLQQMQSFNRSHGMERMQVMEMAETPISNEYRMATVTWGAVFSKTGSTPVSFRISYFVATAAETPRIIMYISHEDQEEVMKAKGLM